MDSIRRQGCVRTKGEEILFILEAVLVTCSRTRKREKHGADVRTLTVSIYKAWARGARQARNMPTSGINQLAPLLLLLGVCMSVRTLCAHNSADFLCKRMRFSAISECLNLIGCQWAGRQIVDE